MNIQDYFKLDQDRLSFSREQASRFAKGVAGDFNPIHDIDAKRFCVPGDLLFSVLLQRYGVSQRMAFDFAGMVVDGIELVLPAEIGASFSLADADGKAYMGISRDGECCTDANFVAGLTEQYVQFSGQTFPHILVELMQREQMMINPARPLVIYKRMAIELDRFPAGVPALALSEARLQTAGKKGEVSLNFDISVNAEVIGRGTKEMVLSGLRAYEQSAIDDIIAEYNGWKAAFSG